MIRRGLITIGIVALGAASASAQNADAEALFTEGERLEVAGKLDLACDAFEASNRIEPRAGTMIRLGQCRESQGRLASAWSAYKDSLTRVKDPKKKAIAEAKVKELELRLSYLTVSVSDESRIDGLVVIRNGSNLDPALWNRAAPVDGGTYTIEGQAPGHESWTTTVEVKVEADKVSVEVPRFKELRTLAAQPLPDDGDDDDDELAVSDRPGMFTTRRKIALGVAGVGVIAVAAGALLGMQAKAFEDDAFALCPDPESPCDDSGEAQDLLDRGGGRALGANVAYGVAGAAIIAATVLWFTGGPSDEQPMRTAVGASVGDGAASFDVAWRF